MSQYISPRVRAKPAAVGKEIEERLNIAEIETIRERAYNIYQKRVASGIHGLPIDDWVAAEREILAETNRM